MKQKIVIKVSMPCEKSRSKGMALVARVSGVSSVEVTGDCRDRLQVVGDGVDPVCLVHCLRKKVGHAEIVQVEEVKAEEKKPEPPKPVPCYYPPPSCYYGHHQVVACEEPSPCSIM
ncbi:heavy metal-associated isoprenylated plant protein 16-like [Oryza brachyantha]|uniref:HMA domain-containing protein n=1 Tax=Oryza brachyantha TaxID=4533 RepID=J3LYN0_ORYBR|nr:heavy metal-associated isoprenylated plant protein 16-like [Oryza brachyantha]